MVFFILGFFGGGNDYNFRDIKKMKNKGYKKTEERLLEKIKGDSPRSAGKTLSKLIKIKIKEGEIYK